MDRFLKPEIGTYNPEPFAYLNPLFAAGEDRRLLLPGVGVAVGAPVQASQSHDRLQHLLRGGGTASAGLFREAACWEAMGVRLAQVREWGAI